jgi:hypothetical protein
VCVGGGGTTITAMFAGLGCPLAAAAARMRNSERTRTQLGAGVLLVAKL